MLFPEAGDQHGHTRPSPRSSRPTSAGARSSLELRVENQRMTAAPIEPRSGRGVLDRRRPAGPLLGLPGRAPDPGGALRQCTTCRRSRSGSWCPTSVVASAPSPATTAEELLARLAVPPVGRPVALDRDPLGDHGQPCPTVAASCSTSTIGGTPRRSHHRLPARRGAGRRRLPDHGRVPADDDPADADRASTTLDNVGFSVGVDRHDRGADHGLPRRGAARGGAGHRAGDRPLRGRDRHGPRRGPAAQPRPRFLERLHDRHRHVLRRGRLRRGAAPGARARGLRRRCAPSRPPAAPPVATVQMGIGLSTYVEITAGGPSTEYGVGRAARRRPDAGTHRGHAVRPGPRHDLEDDRRRPTGVPMDDVEVVHGDTDQVPVGGLTVGSRSVQVAGVARGGRVGRS